jgi:hypothetical protein
VAAVHPCVKSGLRTNWVPTGYPTIHSAKLSTLWKRFCEAPGFDVTRYPRRADIYFNTGLAFSGRFAALIEADGSIERKRKADEMDKA